MGKNKIKDAVRKISSLLKEHSNMNILLPISWIRMPKEL